MTGWSWISELAWGSAALACALATAWLLALRARYGVARRAIIASLVATAAWAGAWAAPQCPSWLAALAESTRNLAWIFALYRLFEVDGRHASMRPVRPLLIALAFVELLQAITHFLIASHPEAALAAAPGFHTMTMLHLLVVVGGLVLLHNLYGGASSEARLVLRWPATALTLLWAYDLNHYAIGYLADGPPRVLEALRGVPAIFAALALALGARGNSHTLRFRPSRSMAFQSISLLLIGSYLVAMVAVAQWLAFAGGDFAALLQIAFVAAASAIALILAPSSRLRGWLRVTLAKHLFQHRYDYRAEWLRFTRTISQGGAGSISLEERVIRAVADIADCPAGMLLTPGDDGKLELAARWQWPTAEVPCEAMDAGTQRLFEQLGYVAELDELRAGRSGIAQDITVPRWLLEEPRAWALVPLLHFERLVGLVVLARPAHARRFDWEDFDLLRVVGQQLASYLAEHAGQEALAEASRFDDFHRRIAFVMHDIKNLASQLSLLARNAELHAENPAFRADMLVTLRNSADKLNALLARLSRYGPAAVGPISRVAADEVASAVAAQFARRHSVNLVADSGCVIAAARDELEQVLLHLVQNAIEASGPDSPVTIRVGHDTLSGTIEVIDAGAGMSAEFVRSRLFRPFDSTKTGGFGIGAYEARELVRAMHGRLEVESREGLGTRFIIRLPLADAAELYKSFAPAGKAGRKVA